MKYAYLLNACHTPAEMAGLAVLFGNACLGMATVIKNSSNAELVAAMRREVLEYQDATRAL